MLSFSMFNFQCFSFILEKNPTMKTSNLLMLIFEFLLHSRISLHTQLGLLDNGRGIKDLVVCWVLPYIVPWVFGQ